MHDGAGDTGAGAKGAEEARGLLAALPQPALLVDRRGTVVAGNGLAGQLLGYEPSELIGLPLEALMPEAHRPTHPEKVASFLAHPAARVIGTGRHLSARRRDGSEVRVEIGLGLLSLTSGPLVLATLVDVSRRERAEREHQQLAAIVESTSDAIIAETLDGAISGWNAGARRLLGHTEAEILGQPSRTLVPEALAAKEEELRKRLLEGGVTQPFETLRLARDGREIPVSVCMSVMRDEEGRAVGLSQIARDISEQKSAEAELARSHAALEEFTRVAAHDLREPLRTVKTYGQLLRERYAAALDERGRTYVVHMEAAATQLMRLVEGLLSYARVGGGNPARSRVSMNDVVASVLLMLEGAISKSGARIEVAPLPTVQGVELELRQVIQNLVANALKFRGAEPPHVVIRAERRGRHWLFSVADNGVGFDMSHAQRIFRIFQTLHASGQYEGTGLGLAIARRVVERHDGSIWAESSPGRGSTFYFTLLA